MKLYCIKRRSDGKFYVSNNGLGDHYFSDAPGQFLRTPDGVAANLRKLCSEYHTVRDNWGFAQKAWRNFDGRKMKRYEVVVLEVDILSMTATPATEFVQLDAVRNIPVGVLEKRAVRRAA